MCVCECEWGVYLVILFILGQSGGVHDNVNTLITPNDLFP